jgi:hypothetical protein
VSRADRALVCRVVDAIDAAKQRGDKHFQVERPDGLTLSDADFEIAVVVEMQRRGKVSRVYSQ